MNNLANTCFALDMHHEALVLQEKALSLLRSVLDENDPRLGVVKETRRRSELIIDTQEPP